MSDELYAALLGVIQGTSEFLPVSSSGHLIIFSTLFDDRPLPLTLNLALHFGTLIALTIYFWRDWLSLGRHAIHFQTPSFENRVLLPGLILGSIPAAVIGATCKDWIETNLHHPSVVVWPLAIVGIIIWLGDRKLSINKQISELKIKDTLMIGFFQACALFPGVSRSGITLLGGRFAGLNRVDAARYSFLLGTPVTAGAILLKGDEIIASASSPLFYWGIIVSALVGCATIKFLLGFFRRFGLGGFAIYRVLLALIIVFIS